MCGIAGVVRWGKKPIEEEQLSILLVGNEHRGNDAAGIAIQQANGSIDILKKDCPAWKLVTDDAYETFIKEKLHKDSECVLMHSRGASQGNPRDNNNNHPMSAGKSAVIHNGVVKNDDILFDNLKLERKAKTDSDVFRAIIDKHGITEEAIRVMSRAVGSGAVAAVHPDFPGKLLLVRSGNPLTIASNEDFFYFSSEKDTLHKACRPYINRRGIWFQAQRPNVDFSNMADHSGWILGPNGFESHTECRICTGTYIEPWRKTYEEYETRQAKWDKMGHGAVAPIRLKPAEDKVKEAWCPKCEHMYVIPLGDVYANYTCPKKKGGCGTTLTFPPPLVERIKVN
jgi:predicted glutamine amidotransferase